MEPAAAAAGTLRDIDHFIFLMKENRSFDHYFGTLSGVRGFDDATAMVLSDRRPVFDQADSQTTAACCLSVSTRHVPTPSACSTTAG